MNQVISQTLRDAVEEVAVPAIDEVALARLVRSRRNRRRAGVAGAVAAALVLPAVGAPLVLDALRSDNGRPDSAPAFGGADPGSLGTVAFVLDGSLHIQAPSQYAGGSTDTGLAVEEVVAVREDGVLVVDRESHVLLVPFDGGEPTRPLGPDPVQDVHSAADGAIGWIGLDNRFWLRLPDGRKLGGSELATVDQRVYDVDAGRWLMGEGDWVSLTDGEHGVRISTDLNPMDAEFAGQTVAVSGVNGTQFVDAANGETRTGPVAGRTGALSGDGRWFVANPNPEETAAGLVPGLWVWDTVTGEGREFRGFDTTGTVADVAWQGNRALAVVSTHAGGETLHTLYSCSVATLACNYHYEDETGTLRLPAS
jgi:hypothetical protein